MTTTERLAAAGLERDLQAIGIRALPASASESVPVSRVLEHADALAAFIERITRWRQAGIPVCLSLTSGEPEVCRHWSVFSAQRHDVRRLTGLGFAIRSGWLPVDATCEALDRFFGAGPRFVFLESLHAGQPDLPGTGCHAGQLWGALVDALRMRGLQPVYGGFVRSGCALLPDEASVEVLPETGLVVPAGSAWQCIHLPLASLCDRHGELNDRILRRVAADAVRFADDLIDHCRWPDERRQSDAERNRRVAFILTGIGDFAVRHHLDPCDFGALRCLSGIVGEIRNVLRQASGRLATERGGLLSLEDARPAAGWIDGSAGESWLRHFEEARSRSLIRHRNLLAMSPYSVLPSSSPSPPGYADLLPLIGQADAWCFSGAPSFAGWNASQFRDFHRRARAVILASQGHSSIAAGA